jgi:hypothetical protein
MDNLTVYQSQGLVMAVVLDYKDGSTPCRATYIKVNEEILFTDHRTPKSSLDGMRILKRSGDPLQSGMPEDIFWLFQGDTGSLESRLRLQNQGIDAIPHGLRQYEIEIKKYNPKDNFVKLLQGL